jgi:hypothetical protein
MTEIRRGGFTGQEGFAHALVLALGLVDIRMLCVQRFATQGGDRIFASFHCRD